MSIAFVQFKGGANYVNIAPTAGNSLWVSLGIPGSSSDSLTSIQAMSATNGGGSALGTLTIPAALSNVTVAGSLILSNGAYLLNLPSGVQSVLANYSPSPPGTAFMGAVELSGASTSSAYVTGAAGGQNKPGTTADAITSGSVSVGSSASYLLGICLDLLNDTTMVAGTGYTGLSAASGGVLSEGQAISASGSYAATFTDATNWGSDYYAATLFAVQAASGGPSASQMLMGDLGLFALAAVIGRRNKLAANPESPARLILPPWRR